MRAAVLHDYGAEPVVESFDDPEAAEGRLVLAVGAAGLNPIDLRVASGALPDRRPPLPSVVGSEGVGRADDGRRFYFSGTVKPFGAVAERTLVEADDAVEVPEGVEDGPAVACGISGTAAYGALIRRGQLREGETVLVLGASGAVGQIAIQAAKLMGAARVVAAARDAEALERARDLGADALVSLRDDVDDLSGSLRAASGGDGFDLALDPLWGDPAKAAIGAMKPFGRVVSLGQSAGAEATLTSQSIRSTPIDLLGYTNYTAGEARKAAAYAEMAGHAARGEITVRIERIGLDDVPEAWQRQGTSPHAKLVVVP